MKTKSKTTKNPRETGSLARSLAEEILKQKPRKKATTIALTGDLGTGKTTFTKSFIRALGVKKKITSPTFLISRRFNLPEAINYKSVYHIDAYRITQPKELDEIEFKDTLADEGNIVVIEWADKIKSVLPEDAVWVKFKHGKGERERHITIN